MKNEMKEKKTRTATKFGPIKSFFELLKFSLSLSLSLGWLLAFFSVFPCVWLFLLLFFLFYFAYEGSAKTKATHFIQIKTTTQIEWKPRNTQKMNEEAHSLSHMHSMHEHVVGTTAHVA